MGVHTVRVAAKPAGEFFLLEGQLSELHVELGKENLLAQVDRHYRAQGVATGAAAVAGDMFGQASNAAMLAMHDGEDTQNFVCLIDGQVVCGQFGGAEMLKSADVVKAVVSRENGVLRAHSILSSARGLLWITHPWGLRAERRANFKLAAWLFVFAMTCISLCIWLLGTGSWGAVDTFLCGVVVAGGLCFGIALWSSSDMKALAGPSTEMFRLLGFAQPETVSLSSFQYFRFHAHEIVNSSLGAHQHRNVYCYQKALEAGRLSLAG
jgi:hypothetical protein